MAIVYNYAQLQHEAAKIDCINGSVNQLLLKMDELFSLLPKMFNGASLIAIQNAHANITNHYKLILCFLTDLTENIRKTYCEIEERDKQNAEEIKAKFYISFNQQDLTKGFITANLMLTYSEVNAILLNIEFAIKSSDTIMSDLEQTMNEICSCWEGQTIEAYFAVYHVFKETIFPEFEALMHTYQKLISMQL